MKIVNATPHDIVLCDANGQATLTIPRSGIVPRCLTQRQLLRMMVVDGQLFPLSQLVIGEVENLPAPTPGTMFVVSMIAGVAAKASGRTDILVVDDAVRDAQGNIVGVKGFCLP